MTEVVVEGRSDNLLVAHIAQHNEYQAIVRSHSLGSANPMRDVSSCMHTLSYQKIGGIPVACWICLI